MPDCEDCPGPVCVDAEPVGCERLGEAACSRTADCSWIEEEWCDGGGGGDCECPPCPACAGEDCPPCPPCDCGGFREEKCEWVGRCESANVPARCEDIDEAELCERTPGCEAEWQAVPCDCDAPAPAAPGPDCGSEDDCGAEYYPDVPACVCPDEPVCRTRQAPAPDCTNLNPWEDCDLTPGCRVAYVPLPCDCGPCDCDEGADCACEPCACPDVEPDPICAPDPTRCGRITQPDEGDATHGCQARWEGMRCDEGKACPDMALFTHCDDAHWDDEGAS